MMTDDSNPLKPNILGYDPSSSTFDWSRLNLAHGNFVNSIYNGYQSAGPSQTTYPYFSSVANPFSNINPFTCTTNTYNTATAPSIASVPQMPKFRIIPSPHPSTRCKRKTSSPPPVAVKQRITEERMALHMSQLHISSEYEPCTSKQYRESTERKEKRLYMCEEMRKLQSESILPKSLLKKISRPCTAVVLWQPPQKAFPLPNTEPVEEEENNNADEMANNNDSNVSNENAQAMDLDMR